MVQLKATVVRNTRVKSNCFHLSVEAPGIAQAALPGQFVMVKAGEGLQPLLRRPFSIHRIGYRCTVRGVRPKTAHRKPHTVEILYEVVGQGTELLSAKKTGEYLDIIGPLGNGFSYEPRPPEAGAPAAQATSAGGGFACGESHELILIAGGMGVAPLLFLAEKLQEIKKTGAGSSVDRGKSKIRVLIGARTKDHILCEKEFKKCGCDVTIATDDGSRGFKGLVTALLTPLLTSVNSQIIYACGPKPMLQAMSGIAKRHVLAAQLSLEAHMACGIGACLGCVVNTKAGYRRVCKEGPVFDALEILW